MCLELLPRRPAKVLSQRLLKGLSIFENDRGIKKEKVRPTPYNNQ